LSLLGSADVTLRFVTSISFFSSNSIDCNHEDCFNLSVNFSKTRSNVSTLLRSNNINLSKSSDNLSLSISAFLETRKPSISDELSMYLSTNTHFTFQKILFVLSIIEFILDDITIILLLLNRVLTLLRVFEKLTDKLKQSSWLQSIELEEKNDMDVTKRKVTSADPKRLKPQKPNWCPTHRNTKVRSNDSSHNNSCQSKHFLKFY
jgi:hypothetical protein